MAGASIKRNSKLTKAKMIRIDQYLNLHLCKEKFDLLIIVILKRFVYNCIGNWYVYKMVRKMHRTKKIATVNGDNDTDSLIKEEIFVH